MPQLPDVDETLELIRRVVRIQSGWDQPPRLLTLHQFGDALCAKRVPVPPDMWSFDHPPRILASFVETFEQYPFLVTTGAPSHLYGWAFLCEVWQPDPKAKRTHKERRQMRLDSLYHRLHTRDDAIEARMVAAVDLEERRYLATANRRDEKTVEVSTRPKGQEHELVGSIYDSLVGLVGLTAVHVHA